MPSTNLKKIRLGDVLVSAGLITEAQLQTALKTQNETGGKLGDVLIQLKLVDETALLNAISNQLKIPFIDLKHYYFNPQIVQKISERLARRYRVLLIDIVENEYLIGMADPTDLIAYDEIKRVLNGTIRLAVVRESDLLSIIDQVYRRTEDIASYAQELKAELGKDEAIISFDSENISAADSAPVVKLLDSIFEDAVQVGASDIHIEPDENFLRIRQRVDGVLQENIIPGKEIISALALRIKLIARLNISEKRLPQDGRFNMKIKGKSIDVRVSTIPIRFGESVVMRLLDQSSGILRLSEIGMSPKILERMVYCIHRPNGLILVTGPTGSGKTTTLYAALSELNDKGKKIISVEDPVEYSISRINQVQVNPIIDLTFANVLRSVLRQDPDIVMIGEMRDEETVKIGLRAAMTGHLVLSTLHTNDSISTALRLLDMGAEGFLVGSAIKAIIAQRLVRKICISCKKDYELTIQDKEWLKTFLKEPITNTIFKKGEGCSRCNHTGYKGRQAIYEFLEINNAMADALRANDHVAFSKAAYKQINFRPLTLSAFDCVVSGETTIEEMFKIATETEAYEQNGGQ
ncbi:MAG: mshE [Francisellaceae bacterium]|nr:mshE [Francisellaceae bacterium]